MGRPRQYANATARQAAYRQRRKATTAWVNRAPYERMTTAIERLHGALWQARYHGSPLASEICRAEAGATLEAVVTWIVQYLEHEQEARR